MRIVVVQSRIPAPQRCGSDVRLLQVLDALLARGHELTFISSWVAEGQDELEKLLRRGVRVLHEDAEALRLVGVDRIPGWSFQKLLAEQEFDRAILCLWFWQQFTVPEMYLEAIRRVSPRTGVIVLSDDRHGERERNLAELANKGAERNLHREYAEDVAWREKECYELVDAIVTVTDADRASAEAMTQAMVPVRTAPFYVIATVDQEQAGFAERSGLLFLGNFANPAVEDTCRWLLNEVMPEVWRLLPDMCLTLAGHGSEQWAGESRPQIEVLGAVDNLQQLFNRYLVFLSPVRVGTGICTKNLMAMAAGLPLVTTPVGAQGLPGEAPRGFRVGDDAAALAREVAMVCTDSKVWETMVEGGRKAVVSTTHGAVLENVLEEVLQAAQPQTGVAVRFSTRIIEERIPSLRTLLPPAKRRTERLRALTLLGQKLIEYGWAEQGVVQLRHALTAVRFGAEPGRGLGALLDSLAHGYRLLGDGEGLSRVREAAGEVRAALLRS